MVAGAILDGMFERLTDQSRQFLSMHKKKLDHYCIGTRHILLGLIQEGDGVAATVRAGLGIYLDAVRREVYRAVGPSNRTSSGTPPFSERCKKALELSARGPLQMGHGYIGTEHLLLGLIRQGEGVAGGVLATLGADMPRMRQEVITMVAGRSSGQATEAAGVSDATGQDGVLYLDGTKAAMVGCGPVDGLRFGVLLVAPEARLQGGGRYWRGPRRHRTLRHARSRCLLVRGRPRAWSGGPVTASIRRRWFWMPRSDRVPSAGPGCGPDRQL